METICRRRPVAVSTPRRGAQRRADLRPLRRAGAGATLVLTSVLALLLAAALVGAAPASAGPPSASPPNLMALLAVEQAQLTASDGAVGDSFGFSVALSGDTALVGVPHDTVGTNGNQGSAYIFTRSGSSWSQQARLTASDGAAWGYFGFSVALSGDTALVGAEMAGEAYVFTRSGSSWSEQTKWTDGDPASDFGTSVALSGDTALVGAFSNVGGNAWQGSAYVFTRSGGSWSQQAQLTATDGAANDGLGSSVALSGDTALVGARNDTVGANAAQGSAYVFTRSGSSWSQQAKLTASDGAGNDSFGDSAALSGETALVGARNCTVDGVAWHGAAYVFTRSGSSWSQQARLTAGYYQFGRSVALSGETALVGAGGGSIGQGSAYLFTRSGSSWSQPAPLTAGDGAADDDFGSSVAVSDETALVGAVYDDVGGIYNQGSAYVFRIVLDSTAPVTTASGLQANASTGWTNTPQSVTLTPTDAGGSGLAATYYTIDGVQHTYSGAFDVSAAGSHIVTYWSTDNAGNEETHHTGYVNIDTLKPTSQAAKDVTVRRSKTAKLGFKISDGVPSCGTAAVTITIKLKTRIVKTIKIAGVPANTLRSYSFKVTLKKGSYTWMVKATDAAGNVGKASAAKKLVVK